MGLEEKRAAAIAFVLGMPDGRVDEAALAPDFDCWNASMGGFISGATYLKGIAGAGAAITDMKMEIDGTVAEGDAVAVRSHSEGTLPDGAIYRNAYHFLFEFTGDKIQRVHAFLNTKTAEEMLMPWIWGDQRTFD
jgi:hypothetical protein